MSDAPERLFAMCDYVLKVGKPNWKFGEWGRCADDMKPNNDRFPQPVEYIRADMAPQWQDMETCPMDSTRVLLAVEIDGEMHVASGGFDDHWTGQCWVFDSKRIPVGTKPNRWMPLPKPPT